MEPIRAKAGDAIRIEKQLTTGDERTNDPADLTDETVRVYIQFGEDALVANQEVEYVDRASGKVAVDLSPSQTSNIGRHNIEWVVDPQGDPTTFPDSDYDILRTVSPLDRELTPSEETPPDLTVTNLTVNDTATVDTLDAGSVNAVETTTKFGDSSSEKTVPLIPSGSQSGHDGDDTTPISFDFGVDDYSEYIVSVDIVSWGGNTEDTLDIKINGISDENYKQVEFDSNEGGISENIGSEWRVGFFSGDGRSYRTLFRIESNNSGTGNNLPSFAPFTAVDTTQPTPFSGFYDSTRGTNVDDISSIQISTSNNATGVVTIKGVKGVQS